MSLVDVQIEVGMLAYVDKEHWEQLWLSEPPRSLDNRCTSWATVAHNVLPDAQRLL